MIPLPSSTLIFNLIIIGLVLGAIFSLMGMGLNLVYGVMRIINFAYGEFYMVGGYALYYAATLLGVSTVLAFPFAALAGFLVALPVERLLIRDTYTKRIERADEYALIGTFALSILFQNIAREIFGPFIRTPKPYFPGLIQIFTLTISWDRIFVFISSVTILILVYGFIKKTWIGRTWQGVSQNRAAALALGVDIKRVSFLAFGTGGMLAATAGALLAPVLSIYPHVGVVPLIMGFVIIVIGGLGSIEGAMIGGLIIGIINAMISGLLSPAYADVAAYVILMIFLTLRPTGLFGERVRRA
ncbi:MAG: branched-chain amino acid ABC transporter permease [Nitrososphaeria archaeon]|nr:branched-chain amino acid ABC transporter permease [Nitrososphaeria archaeon]NIQ33206.1 branched-chain amino acid ABC transporter permease [Nitrososphaeria archaeon]